MTNSTVQQIRFQDIRFPSDRLTIGAIRKYDPAEFAQEAPHFFEGGHGDVSSMLWMERCLAQNAFAGAAGLPLPHQDWGTERDEVIESLNQSYVNYGISTGIQQTKLLIRAFETESAQQAEKNLQNRPKQR